MDGIHVAEMFQYKHLKADEQIVITNIETLGNGMLMLNKNYSWSECNTYPNINATLSGTDRLRYGLFLSGIIWMLA